jgi:hypothetical protein
MLHTAPGYADKEASHTTGEQSSTDPVYALELLCDCKLCHGIETNDEDRHNEANAAKRIEDMETPSPGCVLYQRTAHYRTDDCSNAPCSKDYCEIFWALSQWDNVAKDDLSKCDDATTTYPLNASASKQRREVSRNRTKDCAWRCERSVGLSQLLRKRHVPIVKNRSAMMRSCCRPKSAEIDAMTGWEMAEVRRYDVPVQKASTEVPFSFCAITCMSCQLLLA